ncbi:FMN-binding protein [Candidatus Contubernalis alkaliaceticus]|uniref:FMN-binding protein n=1 Tax=Candidatus Contubernalis alkaliaceticus TaxID=338645 RepID=UPI001F4C0EB3|nr:FMN-binding protein [Candidatus Contubernalis alkalaceticus]UNC92151.1 FMN-binding protein [Candidatus Contubernalis alkalaceticus]
MSSIKKIALVFLSLIVVLALVLAGAIKKIESNMEALRTLSLEQIDIAGIENGTYTGSFSSFPVAAEVRVTVEGQAISEIELVKHNHGQGEAAEVLTGHVLDAQSLDVDVISQATYSSIVILKAIEDALMGAN